MLKSAPRGADWVPETDDGTAKYGYFGAPLNARNVERRVMALFKELKPKKKVVVDGDDEEDESFDFDDGGKDGKVDWCKYETKDDFYVMPVHKTTARQMANEDAKQNGRVANRIRVASDALDNAEGRVTTTERFVRAAAKRK
jgi:hypothetical protein